MHTFSCTWPSSGKVDISVHTAKPNMQKHSKDVQSSDRIGPCVLFLGKQRCHVHFSSVLNGAYTSREELAPRKFF